MTKYYFESKSTGKKVEVSESEYKLVSDSYISNKDNFKQNSHIVVRDNGCDCETTLYVEEEDMPSEEVKDNYDWERLRDEYDNGEITLDIDRTDLPKDLLELHDKNIWEGCL
jgi:hypothetical protein